MIAAELLLGLRWMLGIIFLAAGAAKAGANESFEQSIASYELVPEFLQRPLARSLPVLEICLGAACVLGILPAIVGRVAFVLLLAFAGGVGWNLVRGRRFGCGCGTTHDTTISWNLVIRDLALAASAAAIAVGPSGALALWRGSAALPRNALATSELIPVPMIAILILGMIRLLSATPSAWKVPQQPRHPTHDSAGGLAIAHVSDRASATAKAI